LACHCCSIYGSFVKARAEYAKKFVTVLSY
jgi:hypothetical protein